MQSPTRAFSTIIAEPYIHISVDDVMWVFDNLTRYQYSSIFQQPLLAFLKSMHDKYSIVASMFCFYSFQGICLADMTMNYRREFMKNADWLKWGFHAYDDTVRYDNCTPSKAKRDYNRVIKNLLRITGSPNCIDRMPRIHCYSGSMKSLTAFTKAKLGIVGVLSADDERLCYYLNKEQMQYLSTNSYYYDMNTNIFFLKTHVRIENIDDVELYLQDNVQILQSLPLEIFTHEWAMSKENKIKFETIIQWAYNNKVLWDFPMRRANGQSKKID